MENENLENLNSENETEETENDSIETEVEETEETTEDWSEDVESIKKENTTLKAQKKHWRDKALKLEADKAENNNRKPEPKKIDKSAKSDELSTKDQYALLEAKVPLDDIDDVVKASKLLGKTIPEVLKDDMVKTMLHRKAEERTTANATSTNKTRRTPSTVSADSLMSNLSKGEVPEIGSKEAEDLYWARRGGRRQ